jgi:hypothetical protein
MSIAFTVPPGLADGNYMVYYDEKGNEVYESITSVSQTAVQPAVTKMRIDRRGLTKRSQAWCGCSFGSKSQSPSRLRIFNPLRPVQRTGFLVRGLLIDS